MLGIFANICQRVLVLVKIGQSSPLHKTYAVYDISVRNLFLRHICTLRTLEHIYHRLTYHAVW